MTVGDHRRRRLIGQLPEAHAVALRLDDAGHDHVIIATALGIEPQGIPDLLRVARAKLGHLEAVDGAPS